MALLKGDWEKIKKYESDGGTLVNPNQDGIFPLEAAVYGCNLEAVKYIEGKLKEDVLNLQWAKIDIEKGIEEIEKNVLTELKQGATYGELGKWCKMNAKKTTCPYYDEKCLSKEKKIKWDSEDWVNRGKQWGYVPYSYAEQSEYYGVVFDDYSKELLAPSRFVHDNVVKEIHGQLHELKQLVESKAIKLPSTELKF